MPARKPIFIVNPAAGAGRGQARWEQFKRDLERDGTKVEHVYTSRPGEAMQLARERARSHETLFAVGGDGTAFEVASGILASESPQPALGVVPVGTGNDISAALGIGGLAQAGEAFRAGRMSSIDVIRIECQVENQPAVRHALLFAAVGIASEALKRTTPTVKRLFGERLAYPAGLFRALWSYPAPRLRVALDRRLEQKRFLLVCASNSECAGGGMKLAPGARMDDGRLNVNLIEALGRWAAFMQLRRVCQGRHTSHPNARYLTASEVTMESDTPLEVAADGELIGCTPARFVVEPRGLRVVVADT